MKVKRNIFYVIGLAASIAMSALFATDLAAQPADGHWPQFQGNAQHTGLSPFNGPQSDVYAKWTFPKSIQECSPSIGPDGTIYVTGYGGLDGGTLYALNPDGTEKWNVLLGTITRGAPAIDAEGRIYVGGQNGDLFAIDPPGIIQWVFATQKSQTFYNAGILASPTIGDDGTIFVAGLDGLIYALDRQGNVKWENNVFRHNGDYNWFWGSSPAIGTDGNIYMQSVNRTNLNRGYLFAFDYQTGQLQWAFYVGAALWMTPTVGSDGTIYAGGSDSVNGSFMYALRDHNTYSQVLWSYPLGGGAEPTSAAFSPDGNAIYFKARLPGSNRYFLVKVNSMTGDEIWRYQPMSHGHIYGSSPVVGANGVVYIGTGNGDSLNQYSVIAVNSDGTFLWRYNTGSVIWDTAAIAPDGTLYIGSDELHALVEIEPSNTPPVVDAGSNITITSEEITTTIIQGTASDDDGDVLQYRWISEGVVMQEWLPVGEQGECPLPLASLSLGVGAYIMTLDVSDGTDTASDSMNLTIGNSAPNAAASGGGVYEIYSDVIFIGDVSDYDGDMLYYEWKDGETVICSGTSNTIAGGTPVTLPYCVTSELILGIHNVSLTVDDGINVPVSSQVIVEIVDTTVPTISPVANKNILWPPNHQMEDIIIEANAFDNSGMPVNLSVEVTSNEPMEGTGDGDTGPDWTTPDIDQVTGTIYLQLRAERSGGGSGRVYTIIITATDDSGNSSTSSVEIIVSHDKSSK